MSNPPQSPIVQGSREERRSNLDSSGIILSARSRRDRHAEGRRGLFVLPFALRLLGDLEVGGGGVEAFRTSSTTSCHQYSAGTLSSPSSPPPVSVNFESWGPPPPAPAAPPAPPP